ncbi:hypothetical protein [Neptunomonas japonica]|uniref:hypothetical protein n=1 Tax=Neptunomonas japonica TaxID=417574 RepID=UPI000416A356|nr:hypothetical protein [Neptunomonas japonica]
MHKASITGYLICSATLVVLFLLSVVLGGTEREFLLAEGGLIETSSAAGYFICAIFIIYKSNLNYLKRYHYFLILIIMFGLRELDFDKRFTTMGILKSKFLFSSQVPMLEKAIGFFIILILLYTVYRILKTHLRSFLLNLKEFSTITIGTLFSIAFLVVSKSIDGLGRKLKPFGIELSELQKTHIEALEEILELGIPIMLILTFAAYFKQQSTSPPP